jgi:hypothetical protein
MGRGCDFVSGLVAYVDRDRGESRGCAWARPESTSVYPHVRKNKDEIQGSFPFVALEGQDDDFKSKSGVHSS